MDGCLSVVSVVCCQVEDTMLSRSLLQRSPSDCGASFIRSRNLVNEEAMAHWGAVAPEIKYPEIFNVSEQLNFRHLEICLLYLKNCRW
jgi:hypothetical protein